MQVNRQQKIIRSYIKGRRYENYIKQKLISKGYLVIRSARSIGVFDLIAIKDSKVYGIQVKKNKNNFRKDEIENMINTAKKYGIIPVIAYKDDVTNRWVFKALSEK